MISAGAGDEITVFFWQPQVCSNFSLRGQASVQEEEQEESKSRRLWGVWNRAAERGRKPGAAAAPLQSLGFRACVEAQTYQIPSLYALEE